MCVRIRRERVIEVGGKILNAHVVECDLRGLAQPRARDLFLRRKVPTRFFIPVSALVIVCSD